MYGEVISMSIKGLAEQANPVKAVDVFDDTGSIDKELVEKYYQTNERKKADEKWLKEHKPVVEKALALLNRDKVDVGGLRVSVVVPDTSHFDMDKVLQYLVENRHLQCLKKVVDEPALEAAIADGDIDVEELKSVAWVESKGAPRLTINKVKSNEV